MIEIKEMTIPELEERAAQIAEETAEASAEQLDQLEDELSAMEERRAQLIREAEERTAKANEVIEGEGEVIDEPQKEERIIMTNKEIRSTMDYENAWVEYIKGNKKAEEVRALLSENVELGAVPVPAYVDERIHTAWENDEILRRVRKVFYKGNLKVATEAGASGAAIHTEGGEAIPEEELALVVQILQPETIKKWISISDEVWDDYTGRAFEDYIMDEIQYQLVKLAAAQIMPAFGAATAVGIPEGIMAVTEIALTDIVTAMGQLSGAASDIVFIANRATIAAYQALALTANYGVDPFGGAELIAVDWLPTIEAAGEEAPIAMVADLSAFTFNFPNGDEPTFKIDDLSMAEQDMVKIVGRLPVAAGLTKPNHVVIIGIGEE